VRELKVFLVGDSLMLSPFIFLILVPRLFSHVNINSLASRNEKLHKVAADLVPKLPMLMKSGNDPGAFISNVSDELHQLSNEIF